MKRIIIGAFICLLSQYSFSQSTKIDSIRNIAISYYQNNDLINAKVQFEKISEIDSSNVDALFNLGIINSQQNNNKRAILYFQKCVVLRDRQSAKILKDNYKVRIAYSDFMHFEDVDVLPKYIYKKDTLNFINGINLNDKFLKSINKKLKKSDVIKKFKKKQRIFVRLETDKNGRIVCRIIKGSGIVEIDDEIQSIFENSNNIIPGKYEGKNVGVWSWVLPITI